MQEPTLRFQDHLQKWHDGFEQRLHLVHQDYLREAPREAFGYLLDFLGLDAFPMNARFHRYNSLRGHRTDLCRNASLAAALRTRLAVDYAAVDEALAVGRAKVPTSASQHRSRCERPEELMAGIECPVKGRCAPASRSEMQLEASNT